jgi:hypothetical protein
MEFGKAQKHCTQADKDYWLNQVKNKWDYYMFKQAHNWSDTTIPDDVRKKLVENHKIEDEEDGRPWFSLLSLKVDRDV